MQKKITIVTKKYKCTFSGNHWLQEFQGKKKMKAYLHETKPQVMQEGGLFINMTKVV